MEIFWSTLDFAAKGLVVFLVIAASSAWLFLMSRRHRAPLPHLDVERLNHHFEGLSDALQFERMSPKAFKALLKSRQKREAETDGARPCVYVLEFDGDILATQVERLREEVTAIVAAGSEQDEVVVKIQSPGGAVPHYGLAAAQLVRLRDRKIKVTACIDRIAASGGYLMAVVADSIRAAPFAVIGSIGVVAQVPNIHRLLKRHDIDVEEMTAGKFKRTVSLLGELTEAGKQKLQEQLEETHMLFKDFVKTNRPSLDVEQVSTGEYWLATRAKELGLVDALGTSDDYLLQRSKEAEVMKITYRQAHPLRARLGQLLKLENLLHWLGRGFA